MKKKIFNQSFSRFSIRKLSVGTCSVLLGTFMVMATSPVQADEAQVNNKEQQTQAEIQQKEKSAENGQEVISEPQKVVTQNEAVKELNRPKQKYLHQSLRANQFLKLTIRRKRVSLLQMRRKSNLQNQLKLSRKARKKVALAGKLLLGARDRQMKSMQNLKLIRQSRISMRQIVFVSP